MPSNNAEKTEYVDLEEMSEKDVHGRVQNNSESTGGTKHTYDCVEMVI